MFLPFLRIQVLPFRLRIRLRGDRPTGAGHYDARIGLEVISNPPAALSRGLHMRVARYCNYLIFLRLCWLWTKQIHRNLSIQNSFICLLSVHNLGVFRILDYD